MKITFDNIIFSLQGSGGISVVWYELLKRAIADGSFDISFIDRPSQNIFREQLCIAEETILRESANKIPVQLERYLNPKLKGEGLFHSSYYRSVSGSNMVQVATVHDFTYEYFRSGLAKVIHSKQKANAIEKAQRIICISENTRDDLLRFYPKTDEKKIVVVYNGVDDIYCKLKVANDNDLKRLIPFGRGEYVIYVGDRRSSYKNFGLAIKSCKATKSPIVLVGGGSLLKSENEFLKTELGENNFIQVSGISNIQLNLLYNHALCLLYPSMYEGFGIPVIEAQRAGCPVIAANNSSIPEIIGSVDTCLDDLSIARIAEMIDCIRRDSEFVRKQVEIGVNNSKRFSWDKCYRETKAIYTDLYREHFKS